jgi:hypothetical protein
VSTAESAQIIPIHATGPAEPDSIEALLAERNRLQTEVARLSRIDNKRIEAEQTLAALAVEARQIDEEEATKWAQWATNPDDPLPARLSDRRERLDQKRTLAAGDLANALSAPKAIQPRLAQLHAELAAVTQRPLRGAPSCRDGRCSPDPRRGRLRGSHVG